ncbi:DUF6333 family protein [Streptomyces europaeiscabiei]|uniref:DUF6333 family protein n=1 Tax=Streptomyces europaeiscabiei TaxID=146819 RepID=A0AAJ2UPF7_9ACTN|nr:DUF6333 family protein [Streptomyces europaeiscabiei]MDX3133861.1 DUF6333 family protein [Streptomyces europaeiscabiei]
MTEDTFWNVEEDHEVVRYGEFSLTVVRAPFPGGAGVLAAHDPERAREFVGSFGTVDAVLEELAPVSATDAVDLATRADLDVVRVGCWGGVTEIVDAALGNVGDDFPVWEQAQALRKRYPDAVVIGAATVEHDATYGAWAVLHPDGAGVFAAGWHGEGDWDVEGDVRAVAEAFGIDEDELADEGVDLDDDTEVFDWDGFAQLALGQVAPLNQEGRTVSVFRVRHTEDTTFDMGETWLEA